MSDVQGSGYRSTPAPDPTVLTTQALQREIAALKEVFAQRFDALQTEINARFADQTDLLDRIVLARTNIDAEIQKRTDLQFTLVEQQRIEQKRDTKEAVDSALTAQKDAITKAEISTTKALESLQVSFKTEVDALRRSIDENRDRLAEVATAANAYVQQRQGGLDQRSALAWGLTSVLALLTIGAILFAALKP